MSSETGEVDRFMTALEHPRKAEIEALRGIILGADKGITEHVKWNAPSFCYQGEDRVTMRLFPANRLQLVFHRGVRAKDGAGFAFTDQTGLLEWVAKDRAVVTFQDMPDVEAKRTALQGLVREWMRATA